MVAEEEAEPLPSPRSRPGSPDELSMTDLVWGDAASSLGDATSKSSLGDATSKSSLGDAKSTHGTVTEALGDETERALDSVTAALQPTQPALAPQVRGLSRKRYLPPEILT
jgi:hypothetical protein